MFNPILPVELEDSGFDSRFWDEIVFPEIHRERTMSQSTDPATKNKIAEELRPPNFDYSHQDSLFGNCYQNLQNCRYCKILEGSWTENKDVHIPYGQNSTKKEIPKTCSNSFSSRAYFVVHPEWTSENVDPPVSKPLNRPPWPWEQPRYRQNIQRLHAYKNEQNKNGNEDKNGNESENSNDFKVEELPYTCPSSYKVTHPPEPRLGY